MRGIRGRRLLRTAVATAGAIGLWLGMVPAAEASWSSTYTLSLAGWQGQDWPSVAVDRQGDSLLVWAACDTSIPGCLFQVQARIKPRGGPMGPVKTLSPLGPPASWPMAASDDDGDSAVVWQNGDSQVMGRRISATGSLGVLRTLTPSSAMGINPAVVVAPGGRALVAWPQYENGGWSEAARFFYKDGSLGPVMMLGAVAPDWPGVGIDRLGTAVVAWAAPDGRVVARRVTPGHVSALKVIMPAVTGIGYGMVSIGDDRDGDAVICFRRAINSGSGGPAHVWARQWHHTGTLGTVLHLSPSTDNVTFYHALATDLAGDSMAVWSQTTSSGGTVVYGRRISATGTLGSISRLGAGDRPAVAVDDDGNGLAVWQSPGATSDQSQVNARTISRSGAFATKTEVTSDGRVVRTAASPWGRFTVTWQQSTAPWRIRARLGP